MSLLLFNLFLKGNTSLFDKRIGGRISRNFCCHLSAPILQQLNKVEIWNVLLMRCFTWAGKYRSLSVDRPSWLFARIGIGMLNSKKEKLKRNKNNLLFMSFFFFFVTVVAIIIKNQFPNISIVLRVLLVMDIIYICVVGSRLFPTLISEYEGKNLY